MISACGLALWLVVGNPSPGVPARAEHRAGAQYFDPACEASLREIRAAQQPCDKSIENPRSWSQDAFVNLALLPGLTARSTNEKGEPDRARDGWVGACTAWSPGVTQGASWELDLGHVFEIHRVVVTVGLRRGKEAVGRIGLEIGGVRGRGLVTRQATTYGGKTSFLLEPNFGKTVRLTFDDLKEEAQVDEIEIVGQCMPLVSVP